MSLAEDADRRAASGGPFSRAARNLGKSARTRARLMDAATEVFARDGFEAASVNEITRLAEVANGTFYLHFKDRDAVAAAVALAIARSVVAQLDAAMTDVDDAVERASLATRRFIDVASSEPDWGWALARATWTFGDLRGGVIAYLRADLERGVRQGVFTLPIDDFLLNTFVSMAFAALVSRLRGETGPDAGSRVAELQLRMLGVPADQARTVAWRPAPPLSLRITPAPRDGVGSAAETA